MTSSIPPSQLLTQEDKDRIQALFDSPSSLTPSPQPAKCRKATEHNKNARAIVCPIISKHFYNVRNLDVNPAAIRHDGSFMGYRPTVSQRFPGSTAMKRHIINIGRGVANEVDLDCYGQCNYISFRQAIIFYDEDTKLFELLNYSMYGTLVNHKLFGSDVSKHFIPPTRKVSSKIPTAYVQNKKERIRLRIDPFEKKLSAMGQNIFKCTCLPKHYKDMSGASEASSKLNHGAVLQFGCMSFVFSVLDYSGAKI